MGRCGRWWGSYSVPSSGIIPGSTSWQVWTLVGMGWEGTGETATVWLCSVRLHALRNAVPQHAGLCSRATVARTLLRAACAVHAIDATQIDSWHHSRTVLCCAARAVLRCQVVDTENLTTLLVVVNKTARGDWLQTYEKLSDFVVGSLRCRFMGSCRIGRRVHVEQGTGRCHSFCWGGGWFGVQGLRGLGGWSSLRWVTVTHPCCCPAPCPPGPRCPGPAAWWQRTATTWCSRWCSSGGWLTTSRWRRGRRGSRWGQGVFLGGAGEGEVRD